MNASKMVAVMESFGFAANTVAEEVFLKKDGVVRIGVPPLRLEVFMDISGVDFEDCYERGHVDDIDGVQVRIFHLEDLIANKSASGRHKDLDDVSNLPEGWPDT